MLIPWRVATASHRSELLAALNHFKGRSLAPPDASVAELKQRVEDQADPDQDIWIATGRVERPDSLLSLLHARVEPPLDAAVDVLAVIDPAQHRSDRGYVGLGELVLLASLLGKSGVQRLRLPVDVDLHDTGLANAGWVVEQPGLYTRRA